jgi:integrase
MVIPAQRRNMRRQDLPTRTVHLSVDDIEVDVTMTRQEERRLRRDLQPYLAVARRIEPARAAESLAQQPVRLSQQLREARVAALLGLPAPGTAHQRPAEPQPLDALVERTAQLYAKSLADQTRATYRRRFLAFTAWCDERQLQALPAEPATLMLFVADQVAREHPPSLSTVRGYVHAINRVHLELDVRAPADDTAVSMLMRGLSHVLRGAADNPISALRVDDLRAVCRHLDHPDPVVVRDAAILRLVLAGVTPAVVARLRWSDIRFDKERMLLGERLAKNANVTSWCEVPSLTDPSRCPVVALQRWRSIAGTRPAVVFTLTDRTGRRDTRTLGPSGITKIVASRTDSLGPQAGGAVDLAQVADLLRETATDVLRDRALLLLGFALAARRNELTNMNWQDIRFVDDGLLVRIRRSKTDLEGRGSTVGVPWGRSVLTCPVRAVMAWHERVRHQLVDDYTDQVPVFMKVGRAGRITQDAPLSNEELTMIVKRRMEAAGIPGHWGGRSLRAGLISSCADLDLPLDLIAQQSRHASLDNLVKYIRTEDVFRRNAVEMLGL